MSQDARNWGPRGSARHLGGLAVARLVSRLKMRHLLLLRNIDQFGSLTRVAQETGVSQPAVTKTLGEIEAAFDAVLFHRAGRGLVPTPMGELAMRRAAHMLQDLDHWAQEMEAVRQGHRARLSVGVVPYVPGSLLTRAIASLQEQYNIIVSIRQATSDILVEALADHEIDCVIGRASAAAGREELSYEVLYTQRAVLIGHVRLVERLRQRKVDWRGLASLKWILPSPLTPVGAKMLDLFAEANIPAPIPIIETYSLDVIHGVVSTHEDTISVVPEDIAQDLMRRGGVEVLPWDMECDLPPISLIRRKHDRGLPAEEAFIEIFKALIPLQLPVPPADT